MLNLHYTNVNQYRHLLFTQGTIINNDVWVPSEQTIPKSEASTYSAGWTGQFLNGNLHTSLDVYYKAMSGLTTYREGYSSLRGDTNWRSKIVSGGTGVSRGVELAIKKTEGAWTGFLNYTLSNTTYEFPEINRGDPYLYEYDRLHSLTLNLGKRLSANWSANLTWVYQSGLPYTPAIGRVLVPDTQAEGPLELYEALLYGDRNSARMRPYHRLDLGFTYRTESRKRKLPVEWNFSIYNAYNRRNAYYYYYNTNSGPEVFRPETNETGEKLKLYQMSFFPIIPTVSYKIFFGEQYPKNRNEDSNLFQRTLKNILYHD